MDRTALTGAQAEQLACRYLKQQGLKLLCRNYRCRFGEIDLIMRDRDGLVFVEVRYRSSSRFGTASESVDHHKQRKLTATAQEYLRQHSDTPARFDVVAISPDGDGHQMEWISNAFDV